MMMTEKTERIEWYEVAIINQREVIIKNLIKEKQELIREFLNDFQWYLAFEIHFIWIGMKAFTCRCKTNPAKFKNWMIKKWEMMLK